MPRIQGRLDKLERALALVTGPPKRFRVVADSVGLPNLATSRCTRTLWNGTLSEIVVLKGSRNYLSDEELEKFIESFPIQEEAPAS